MNKGHMNKREIFVQGIVHQSDGERIVWTLLQIPRINRTPVICVNSLPPSTKLKSTLSECWKLLKWTCLQTP